VSEEFGVKRAEDDGRHIHVRPQIRDLAAARIEKVVCVMVGGAESPVAIVDFFLGSLAGNAVVF